MLIGFLATACGSTSFSSNPGINGLAATAPRTATAVTGADYATAANPTAPRTSSATATATNGPDTDVDHSNATATATNGPDTDVDHSNATATATNGPGTDVDNGNATATETSTETDVDFATATASSTMTATATASATATATATAVAQGCQPSRKIAFVNCLPANQSGRSMDIGKGGFDMDVLDCSASTTTGALQAYDTIVYLGTPDLGLNDGTGKYPQEIQNRLTDGAKVVNLLTGECEGNSNGCAYEFYTTYYLMGFESNTQYPDTIGTSTISVTHPNSMTQAFSQTSYSAYHLNYLMLPDWEVPSPWCSDLAAWVPGVNGTQRLTAFHGFLPDEPDRKGLLITTSLTYQDQPKIDFADPFLAAQLTQPWNQAGNSAACGLSCDGGPMFSPLVGMGKPVIYLYPEKEEDVSVRLDLDGTIVTSYPQYDAKAHGWSVRARPDGTLTDKHDGREYGYLYWSGESTAFKPTLDEGFVVKGEDTQAFLQKTLAAMGMTAREANDMIVYWLPYMQHHKYNLISFAKDSYERVAKMTVTPKPDSLLRVFMVFKHLDQPVPVKPQRLERFKRKGFTVVEWGGSEIDGDWRVLH